MGIVHYQTLPVYFSHFHLLSHSTAAKINLSMPKNPKIRKILSFPFIISCTKAKRHSTESSWSVWQEKALRPGSRPPQMPSQGR